MENQTKTNTTTLVVVGVEESIVGASTRIETEEINEPTSQDSRILVTGQVGGQKESTSEEGPQSKTNGDTEVDFVVESDRTLLRDTRVSK